MLRPYLALPLPSNLQKRMHVPKEELSQILEIMNTTKFGHLYRRRDRVSKEISVAMRRQPQVRAVAISLAVRYSQSPRGLAASLAQQDKESKFVDCVVAASRGRAYRQTGVLNLVRKCWVDVMFSSKEV